MVGYDMNARPLFYIFTPPLQLLPPLASVPFCFPSPMSSTGALSEEQWLNSLNLEDELKSTVDKILQACPKFMSSHIRAPYSQALRFRIRPWEGGYHSNPIVRFFILFG